MEKSALYLGDKRFKIGTSLPESPMTGEVLLKINYCGICGTDLHIFRGHMDQRVRVPHIIGHEVSGEIVSIGKGVSGFKEGDKVVVRPLMPGIPDPSDNGFTHIGKNLKFMGVDTNGGMQGFWKVPAYTLHRLPDSLPLIRGALIEPLSVACHDVRRSRLTEGENVVVIGGGPIGLLISLVAKASGANVLLTEVNESRVSFARNLGLKCINPTETDLLKELNEFSKGRMADVVFEVSGSSQGVKMMTELTNIRGRIVIVAIHPKSREIDLHSFFWKEMELIGTRVYEPEDFEKAIQLAESDNLPLESLISGVTDIQDIQSIFQQIDESPQGVKYLIKCS